MQVQQHLLLKINFGELIRWYENQLTELGVTVKLNTFVTADDPILEACDQIFVGTGAVPIVPPIPGING